MAKLNDILAFLSREFRTEQYPDRSLNGLQVEGAEEVDLICSAVDAGHSVIKEAAKRKAQMLLVHHGIFWGSPFAIAGPKGALIKTLLDNSLSLVAMHLPLDAHMKYGNNILLSQHLNLANPVSGAEYQGMNIGCIAENSAGQSCQEMVARLQELQGCAGDFVSLMSGPEVPQRVCLLSGGGAEVLLNYEKEGFDTVVSGEPKQFAYHFCKENKLNALFPGHYATETLGVKKTAEVLAAEFGVEWQFIDEPTGI